MTSRRDDGFTLIELLIVVAIILIIAAIAIPNLLKSRMAANESSAVGTLRTYNTAVVTYAAQCPNLGFPVGLVNMAPGAGDYTTNADPQTRGTTGQRSFFSDQTGVIRFNQTAAAAAGDLAIQ